MVLSTLTPERREMALQVARFAFAGFLITILFSGAYWLVVELAGVDPNIALTIVFLVFSLISYVTHGEFSFQGHGGRDRPHIRMTRFLLVNIIGFLINQFFVWLLVKHLDGPSWWPILAFIFITPWVTFALHRRWVYA